MIRLIFSHSPQTMTHSFTYRPKKLKNEYSTEPILLISAESNLTLLYRSPGAGLYVSPMDPPFSFAVLMLVSPDETRKR